MLIRRSIMRIDMLSRQCYHLLWSTRRRVGLLKKAREDLVWAKAVQRAALTDETFKKGPRRYF